MKKARDLLLIILFLITLFVPRFSKIERPITVDEVLWIRFSSGFLYGLVHGEFDQTYQDHHPGVTTMASGTLAYVLEKESYRAVQLHESVGDDTLKLVELLVEDGYPIFKVLVTARTLMALACSLALIVSLWFLWRLWGGWAAWITMMFVILDPMVIGQTRLYSHEGLMSCLLLLAWLSFYHYLKQGRNLTSLLVSGFTIGLATLTKITVVAIVPIAGLVLLVDFYQQRNSTNNPKSEKIDLWRSVLIPMVIWLAVLSIVFVGLWPAAWANPVQTVVRMFNHTMGFVDSGNLSAVQGSLDTRFLQGLAAYLKSVWAHPTLLTWFGNLVVLIAFVFRKRLKINPFFSSFPIYFYLYAGIMISLISAFSSFRADRYLTSVHVFIAFLGGLGFAILIEWMKGFDRLGKRKWINWVFPVVFLLAQVVTIYPARPYYYTYLNPLARDVWWGVHGAFLDQAGDYLAEKPDAESMTVFTFSPGSFMFFFPGETRMLVPYAVWGEREVKNIRESDYLLINFELVNLDQPPRVISDIADVEPEQIISFQGREYVWIYRVEDLPASVFIPD